MSCLSHALCSTAQKAEITALHQALSKAQQRLSDALSGKPVYPEGEEDPNTRIAALDASLREAQVDAQRSKQECNKYKSKLASLESESSAAVQDARSLREESESCDTPDSAEKELTEI